LANLLLGSISVSQTLRQAFDDIGLEHPATGTLTRHEVRFQIAEIGIIPAVCVTSAEEALFAAEAVREAGIPVLEISMTFPGSIHAISHLAKHVPEMIVGGGSILNADTARRCVDEGAKFLTTEGLVLEVVEFAAREDIVVFPGALTPTEIIAAWKAGSDFVKVVPCDAMGGPSYIRSLKTALPQVRLIAAGGVNRLTAVNFVAAGATALGVGRELIPREAIRLRQSQRIQELARRFLGFVGDGRL
jgi:2-dehydro-3-deoxyphosphogluconate aldolase/(4S)-4-hydroxy-2-oxoglutarate aldolase